MNPTITTNSKVYKSINLDHCVLIKPHSFSVIVNTIKKIQSNTLTVYDITYSQTHANQHVFEVSDHTNQTGHNPLIGHQKKLDKQFFDVSQLYTSKKGITTNCLGKHFDKEKHNHQYPSEYLCYISIIARAVGVNKIKAYLINIL